jgi:hypothetical protein
MFRNLATVLLALIAPLATLIEAAVPASADVQYVSWGAQHNLPGIFVSGDIQNRDVSEFAKIVESKPAALSTLFLDSPGGDAYAAMAIGRIARKNMISTWVQTSSKCFSSCALIYIAGVNRFNEGTIGLHRPYLAGTPLDTVQIVQALPKLFSDVRQYVTDMGVTEEFTNIMLNTAPENMRVFAGNDILNLVPATDAVFDEILVAHEARAYGVSTEEMRQRQKYADDNCARAADINSCEQPILWGLSNEVFTERSTDADAHCKMSDAGSLKVSELPVAMRWDSPVMVQHFNCMRGIMLAK